ncbi:sarcosine oxidase subunit alpha family protein [Agrobacterium vitis]|uniref:Sarcosine oxidase subunit alpha family protein n=1 Tax=Agrobacterium vitis TaxID=373 RepID=A0ABD6G5C0_AGRVI|nr:sarcosine oxidase subunit alpha [Agrobacterium vitis]MUO78321.1 sarcosine oxidase subunit alpha family protein [Agrobacterium vitis]MUO94198.1 sarcosine oxidase subunit alpha family protein [Agrobacterium vitis]MUP03347.1 sarcosine oxidase subunit alpha family protein [Agrobacterium vitis]MUZ84463.1 sarcosine oxidase subunit alpha family protein [Agrobacterium vitis]MVA10313.1 sarcosine oxidase subunit alpha family protein [Agrobacterium vitis]
MSGANRIPGKGRLTPARTARFTVDGRILTALEGDSVASALLANGIHLVGRSFKYHRPRGILTAGPEEPNALLDISRDSARRQPNVRAPVQEVFDGMRVQTQNRWPSLSMDIGAVNDLLSPFFAAGFYYKTFMWPKSFWHKIYEPIIRRAAGLGVAPTEDDTDHYANRYAHCDVMVVGGGVAGLTAALAAAETGPSVIICDEQPEMGGAFHYDTGAVIDGQNGYDWAQATVAKLKAMDNVTVLTRTTAFGYYNHNFLGLAERITDHIAKPAKGLPRERLWQVRAKKVVLATGAIERHMVFANNDRPGIMLASAARTYLNHFGVAVGAKVAVYTAHDSAYETAIDLKKAGVQVVAIIDCRRNPGASVLADAKAAGIEVLTEHCVLDTAGRLRVKSITIAGRGGFDRRKLAVDALLMSGGWTPSVHLFSQSRGKLRFEAATQRFLPDIYVQDSICVGACNGTDDLSELLAEAYASGTRLAKEAGAEGESGSQPSGANAFAWTGGMIGAAEGAGPDDAVKAFIDFQHDVCAKDIRLAVREGMHSIEHIKRFTTNGMASDQGKLSNMHGLAIAAEMLGKEIPQVGLTTFRAPYTPVTFGTLINHSRGELFDPTRKTPMHDLETALGADFEDVGNWKRAWYYPKPGEDMHAAVNRECKTVREVAGVFNASTLGKIEVVGPDAAKFLNLIYTNPWDSLKPGKCRYGIMTRDDGFIYDDGVVGRLAEDRFHVTTTTGGAARVLNHMEDYLQTEFPELKVWLTSASEQWAVIAVQGPKARDIIAPFVEGIDISNEAFPHMSVAEGRFCGVPTRLFRVSFTGEVGFEINVPADYGASVFEAVWKRAESLGACLYGTETMHVLRAEKGYIIVGQDTDGTLTPDDANYGWAVSKKKPDFVGIRGLKRPDLVKEGRKQLVGLKTKDPNEVLEEGAQIVANPNQPKPMTMLGHVTSSYWSENLGQSIAIAMVAGGRARMGETLYVPMPDKTIAVEVTDMVFYDKEGSRIHG